MATVEEVVRRRAVGAWFLDHKDRPLQASLPLFPPDVEQELVFQEGSERLAMTFTFPFTEEGLDPEGVVIWETLVRCGVLLSSQRAGLMLLGKEERWVLVKGFIFRYHHRDL